MRLPSHRLWRRRLAGPVAAITAATVLAATPVTMELNRGNVSDSLLILLAAVPLACLLLSSASASAVVVTRGLGPFETPFGPSLATDRVPVSEIAADARAVIRNDPHPTPIIVAVYTSAYASDFIFYTGKEVLPIGGYSGMFPPPTVSALARYVSTGQLRLITVPIRPASSDPRIVWIRKHCAQEPQTSGPGAIELGGFDCSRGPTRTRRRAANRL
jgi:hypothetical protein